MAYINKSMVRKKMLKGLSSKSAEQKIYKKVNAIFLRKKEKLIRDFESHPITREIKGGASSANISGTLGGYGNLYSFIGFSGGDPTSKVSQALRAGTRLMRRPRKRKRGKSIVYDYRIAFPDTRELGSAAPMPWEPGNWVDRIERGISGLGNYIYHKYVVPSSRSGRGTQSKRRLSGAVYSRTTYMSAIFSTFRKGWRI